MRRVGAVAAVIAVMLVLGLLAWRALAPRAADADVLSGYLEGEALYLASPMSGAVKDLRVRRGERVAAGAPVFTVDPRIPAAQRGEATAQRDQARAQVRAADAQAAQQEAQVRLAAAEAANARRDADRYAALAAAHSGAVSVQETDRAKTAAETAQARLQAAEQALRTLQAQAQAARAAVDHADAGVTDAETRLGQMSAQAPAAGVVEETFFQPGEWAMANQPVVSLIPDGKVKLRFYVPERSLSAYRLGRSVRYGCDGCGAPRTAVIRYVSPRPEFTPPVIYSRKARDRMVFLVEATPAVPTDLAPGQPVDVTPLSPDGGGRR